MSRASRRTSSEGDGQNARRKRGRAWDGRCRPAGGPSGAPVFSRRASHHCREHSARGCSAGLNPGGKCEVAGACDEHRCSHEGLESRGKWQPEGCAPGTDPESTPGARSEQGGSWIDMPPCDGTNTTVFFPLPGSYRRPLTSQSRSWHVERPNTSRIFSSGGRALVRLVQGW